MPKPNENLIKLHQSLLNDGTGFNVPFDQFEKDMQDEQKLTKLHQSLMNDGSGFNVPLDKFKADMGYGVYTGVDDTGKVHGIKEGWKAGVGQLKSGLMEVGANLMSYVPGTPNTTANQILKQSLKGTAGEGTDPLSQEQDRIKQKADNVLNSLPEGEGFMYQLGTFLPQAIGIAAATLSAPLTAGTSLAAVPSIVGGANIAMLVGSSMGSAMNTYEEYMKSTGQEPNEAALWGVGIGAGAAEYFAEKIGLNRYMPKSGIIKSAAGLLTKGGQKEAIDMFSQFAQKQSLLQVAKKYGWNAIKHAGEEGFEEVATELGNIAIEKGYRNVEDSPKWKEISTRTWQSFQGGALMGGVLSPMSTWSRNAMVKKARANNGFVALIKDKDGKAYEALYKDDKKNGYQAVDASGNEVFINEADIDQLSRFGLKDFDNFLKMAKQGKEITGQIQAEAELSAEYDKIDADVISRVYRGNETFPGLVNGVQDNDPDVIITAKTHDGEVYQVISGSVNRQDASNPMIGINIKTGEKRMISNVDVSNVDIVPAAQMRAELRAEAAGRINGKYQQQYNAEQVQDNYQPGDEVYFNGVKAEIVDVSDPSQGVSIKISDGKGGEQVVQVAPDQLQALQPNEQAVNGQAVNGQQAPASHKMTIGKKQFTYKENDNGSYFVEFADGKDETKAISAEVDDTQFDIVPVTEEVPIPNAPPFAKKKTQTVVKGVNIVPKAAANEGTAVDTEVNQPVQQVAGEATNKDTQAVAAPVQPSAEPVGDVAAGKSDAVLTKQTNEQDIQGQPENEGVQQGKKEDENTAQTAQKGEADGGVNGITITNEGSDNLKLREGVNKLTISSNGNAVGQLIVHKDNGTNTVGFSQIDSEANRNKGIASTAYELLANELSKTGETLSSGTTRTESSTGMWEKLVKQGKATKKVNADGEDYYEFNAPLAQPVVAKSETVAPDKPQESKPAPIDSGQETPASQTPASPVVNEQVAGVNGEYQPLKMRGKEWKFTGNVKEKNGDLEFADPDGNTMWVAKNIAKPVESDQVSDQVTDQVKLPEQTDDIRIVDGEVYYKQKGATTAKRGFARFSNGKSRFKEGYKSLELPEKLNQESDQVSDQAKPISVTPEKEGRAKDIQQPAGEQPVADSKGVDNTPDAVSKEPWEMTREEFTNYVKELRNKAGITPLREDAYIDKTRIEVIKKALSEGKPVPPEVLKDYPELAKETQPQPEFAGDVLNKAQAGKAIEPNKEESNQVDNQEGNQAEPSRPQTAGQHLENILIKNDIADAEAQVNTNPTEAQKEAGNYKKGRVTIQGMDIAIEQPKGSIRKGTDEDGKEWQSEMKNTYGYFEKTNGRDGDQIDTFIGDNPTSDKVFVIDQNNPKTGKFDESKVMLGFDTKEQAKASYLSNYEAGWKGFRDITEVSVGDFKKWLYDGKRQMKPFGEYAKKNFKKKRTATISKEQRQVRMMEFYSPEHLAMQYFAEGGKLHPSSLFDIFGTKGRENDPAIRAKVESERKPRFTWVTKNGMTINQIAHNLWMENAFLNFEDDEYRNAVIDAVLSYNSPQAMAKDLLRIYNEEQQGAAYSSSSKSYEDMMAENERMIEDEVFELIVNNNQIIPSQEEIDLLFLPYEQETENGESEENDQEGVSSLAEQDSDREVSTDGDISQESEVNNPERDKAESPNGQASGQVTRTEQIKAQKEVIGNLEKELTKANNTLSKLRESLRKYDNVGQIDLYNNVVEGADRLDFGDKKQERADMVSRIKAAEQKVKDISDQIVSEHNKLEGIGQVKDEIPEQVTPQPTTAGELLDKIVEEESNAIEQPLSEPDNASQDEKPTPKTAGEKLEQVLEGDDTTTEARSDEFIPQESDVNYQLAYNAYRGSSFSPDKRAKSVQDGYVKDMNDLKEKLESVAKSDEQKARINAELAKYKDGYLRYLYAWLNAKSRTLSSMITGPANFPVARNRKALDVEAKRNSEFIEWEAKATKRAIDAIKGAATTEQKQDEAWQSISNNIISSASTIIDIDTGKNTYSARPLFVSSITGLINRMFKNGQYSHVIKSLDLLAELNSKATKPIITSKSSIWELRNKSEAELQKQSETIAETEDAETGIIYQADGIEVVNNRAIERVQIITPEKPSQEVIKELKSSGWNWSPSNKAWQRKNTIEGIRSAEKIASKFYPKASNEDTDIRFRSQSFYSPTERALQQIKQERGSVAQFKAMLLKNGAKQAEMDWMDFDGSFSGQKSVTKADIQDWIDQNRVEVQEVEKASAEKGTHGWEFTEDAQERYDELKFIERRWERLEMDESVDQLSASGERTLQEYRDEYGSYDDLLEKINEFQYDNDNYKEDLTGDTKFSQYVLPGGENYREVLLVMPEKRTNVTYSIIDDNVRYGGNYKVKNDATGEEILGSFKTREAAEKWISGQSGMRYSTKDNFKSSHFDEPNILAHVRFNERIVNGERVLFIEEIQSDWAQKGKKEGFKINENKYKDIAKAKLIEVVDKLKINKQLDEVLASDILNAGGTNEDTEIWRQYNSPIAQSSQVPDMPFRKTDQWVGLAMRRMVQYAVDNGFDRISWTTGEQQAERYDLSKVLNSIEYEKDNDGTGWTGTWTVQGNTKNNGHYTKRKLDKAGIEEHFGKEIAEKITSSGKDEDILIGLDLKVGGEGMKAFYDNIIPAWVNKNWKKYGVKVENSSIDVKPEITDEGINTDTGDIENPPSDKYATVHSVKITPELSEAAKLPQPMFRNEANESAQDNGILTPYIKRADEVKQRSQRAKELGAKYGVPVRVITNRAQLPDRILRKMRAGRIYPGVFDIRTGQIYVLVNEVSDMADIEKTIAHEVVAHKGLREMLGAVEFDNLLDDVYSNMNNADIIAIKEQYDTQDSKIVADEYMASLAETGKFPNWFSRVIMNVRSLLRKAGFNVAFTDADIMYLLWESRRRLMKNASAAGYVDYKANESAVMENVAHSNELFRAIDDRYISESTFAIDSMNDYLKEINASTLNSNNINALIYRFGSIINRGSIGKIITGTYNGYYTLTANTDKVKTLLDRTLQLIGEFNNLIESANITDAAKEMLNTEIEKYSSNIKVMNDILDGKDVDLENVRFSVSAFHGSPHSFDRFSTDYIGTGEGAQAFGWGLYFTDKKGIAESYAEKLVDSDRKWLLVDNVYGQNEAISYSDKESFEDFMEYGKTFYESKINLLKQQLKEAQSENNEYLAKKIDNFLWDTEHRKQQFEGLTYSDKSRNLYTVAIHAGKTPDQYDYLRWDKGFKKEHLDKIKKQLTNENIQFTVSETGNAIYIGNDNKHPLIVNDNNYSIYAELSSYFGSDKAASQFLLRAGIDGIKYPAEYLSKGSHEDAFNYVVFDENAVEIEDHIRFKVSPKTQNTNLDPKMIQTRAEALRETFQDKMLSAKKLMETVKSRGGNTPQSTDFYNAENRMQSRSMAMITNFNNNELDNLNTTLAQVAFKHNKSLKDINLYLKAKSSLERNDNEGISAISDDINDPWNRQAVEKIVADFEADVPMDLVNKLWNDIKVCTDFTIRTLYLGNVISKSAYEGMRKRKYYVPLRSWAFGEGENPVSFYEYLPGERTAYQGLVKAKGRISEADDPLAYIESAAHSAVVSANRNMMKRKLGMLARMNPDMKDLFNIKKIFIMQTGVDADGNPIYVDVIKDGENAMSINGYDTNGNPILVNQGVFEELYEEGKIETKINKAHMARRPKYLAAQHEVEFYENGERYVVALGDPAVANAVNNNNTMGSEFIRMLIPSKYAAFQRWLTAGFTAKNPAFIPINWVRDFGYATVAHAVRNDGDLKSFMKNYPASVKAIHRYLNGKANPTGDRMDMLYEAFRLFGGETGYVHLNEVEDLKKNIEKEINRKGGVKKGWDKVSQNMAYKAAGKSLDYLALMSENSARFATFVASVENGKSYEQAATDAKNITVNFNRKGRISGVAGMIYGFFNATIQGGHNFLHMSKHNKKRMAVASTAFIATGLLLAELLRAIGPEDDDGNKEYDKLPAWVRQTCLVIPTWGDGFITIPLPPGFRSLYGIGVSVSDLIHGKASATEAAFDTVGNVFDMFSPFTINDNEIKKGMIPVRSVIPTALVPIYDISVNQDFTGREIFRTPFAKNMERYTPDSELGAYNANSILKGITRGLNKLGGGNEYTPAGINVKDGNVEYSGARQLLFDWNPSKIEHLLEYYLGGRGRFFNDVFKTAQSAVMPDKDVKTYNIPVLKRLYTKPYDGDAWNDYREIQINVNDYKYLIKESQENRDYETLKELYGNKKMLTISSMFDAYNKSISDLTDLSKSIPNIEAQKNIKEQRDILVKTFIKNVQKLNEPSNTAK